MNRQDSCIFDYEERTISISEIDLGDDACRLDLHTDPGAVVTSIRTIGLVNPPVLRRRQDLKYQVVCGFRRVAACKVLGWNELNARILKGTPTEFDTLKLAILDNRSHRQLSVVEQARGIQKVSSYLAKGDRLQTMSSLLGFPQNRKVFQKLRALSRLPAAVHAGVRDEIISFEASVALTGFSDADVTSFLELFKALKLSQNKQTEVIALVQEIAIREERQPGEVLNSEEIGTILDHSELNRNEKGSKIRAYLKRRRFPTLTKVEERFSEELKALKLDEHIQITAPPYFEGGHYTLRMTFKNVKDFDERRKVLDAISKNPALRRLLEPHEE